MEGTQPPSGTGHGSTEIRLWTTRFALAEKSVKSNFPQVLLCWRTEEEMPGASPCPCPGEEHSLVGEDEAQPPGFLMERTGSGRGRVRPCPVSPAGPNHS